MPIRLLHASKALPPDLATLWRGRLEDLDLTPQERAFLELAATLGLQVDESEWQRACSDWSLACNLLQQLLNRSLVFRSEDPCRWDFAHGMFREAILEGARDSGREASNHLRIAQTLQGYCLGERLAHHLAAANHLDEAFFHFLHAHLVCVENCDYLPANRHIQEAKSLLARLPFRNRMSVIGCWKSWRCGY